MDVTCLSMLALTIQDKSPLPLTTMKKIIKVKIFYVMVQDVTFRTKESMEVKIALFLSVLVICKITTNRANHLICCLLECIAIQKSPKHSLTQVTVDCFQKHFSGLTIGKHPFILDLESLYTSFLIELNLFIVILNLDYHQRVTKILFEPSCV